MTVHDGATGGSFSSTPCPTAFVASSDQRPVARSIMFMPAPSPGSIAACRPAIKRREERTDEVDATGSCEPFGILLQELPDLRAGEPLERP